MSEESKLHHQSDGICHWHWSLDPNVIFLNHGSFGACPLPVLEFQRRLREQLEREPVRFLVKERETLLDNARKKLASFLGGNPENLVFVPNATTGVNAVLRSLHLQPGDELLTTDHEYNACRNALEFVGDRADARIVVAPVPFPIESPQQVIEAVMERVSTKTKLVLLDHVTSQTGLIFPIKKLVSQLAELGIDTLVDGAHAPGMLPLNLDDIGAAYYTGNCHKWMCTPKGAAFLYVQQKKQKHIRPLTISHGANSPRTDKSRFQLEFDWMGTDDPTAYLCVPVALEFMGSLVSGGWPELMAKNRSLVLMGRQIICEAIKSPIPSPDDMIGSLASIILPDSVETFPPASLQDTLCDRFNIQVPIIPSVQNKHWLIRLSAQIYNTRAQYYKLADALKELLVLK